MKPYWKSSDGDIYHGHVMDVLKSLPDESVQMCVTSPPYWGLRDYGIEPQVWDGDKFCQHAFVGDKKQIATNNSDHKGKIVRKDGYKNSFRSGKSYIDQPQFSGQGKFCQCCNAWRGSLGLEPTPELYIKHVVQIFAEVKRVLRKDATCWINLGDSFQNKQLLGMPWRVAFALQDNGWWLRSDIIWSKPNPMPESVTDRPTKAHEYMFLLTKSAKYYYDADALREPLQESTKNRYRYGWNGNEERDYINGPQNHLSKYIGSETSKNASGRNKRTVWTIPTEPLKDQHFASFPSKLVEPCILAGCPKGGIVLEPFLGSGKTFLVAYKHGRRCIGIELNKKYLNEIAIPKIEKVRRQMRMFK